MERYTRKTLCSNKFCNKRPEYDKKKKNELKIQVDLNSKLTSHSIPKLNQKKKYTPW